MGAGPAGSAAAIALCRAGVDVVLADRHAFPRDKTCGDALIPDALHALSRLGLRDTVTSSARTLGRIRIYAPNGAFVTVNGEFACLPRNVLDALLQRTATEAGALFLPRRRVEAPIVEDGVVRGARFRTVPDGGVEEVRAEVTVLATGAASGPLGTFGVLLRDAPSAIALRAYYAVPDDLARSFDHLCISFDAAVCPGYGWVFPGPGNVFNLGVGFFYDAPTPPASENPRELWTRFVESFAPAREIVARGRALGPPKGAPLRCNVSGSRFHRPGLLIAGEAAGLTFSLSGEGIGKALESGLVAAEVLAPVLKREPARARDLGPVYERVFRERHGARYRGYRVAQRWLAWPSVCNFIANRAERGSYVRRQLEGMINESVDPRALFSASGIVRAMFR